MRKHAPHISDEFLNSYIDQQITSEERQLLLSQINEDKELAKRVCELQQLKDITQMAYEDIPDTRYPDYLDPSERNWQNIAAAVMIFVFGVLLGQSSLLPSSQPDSSLPVIAQFDREDPTVRTIEQVTTDKQVTTKVLVHLTSDHVKSGLNTLQNLEQLLVEYEQNNEAVQVEVVANGNGIKLLRPDVRQIAERIAYLSDAYQNLTFAACKNTIDQIQLTEGRLVDLIPQVQLIESGVVEVIRRQQDGWTYIRG